MDFPDSQPLPHTPFAYSIPAIIPVPAGSAKCDLAPLIAGGGCGAGAAREAGLVRRRQRRPPSPGAHQPAGVANECGKGPTLPNTHTHRHAHGGGGLGASWPRCWPLGISWTQRPFVLVPPAGLPAPTGCAVAVPTKQASLRGGSSPSNQAQAHSPCPRQQPPPTPVGYPWKACVCSHLSSSQWR